METEPTGAFLMDRHPVTNREYAEFIRQSVRRFKGYVKYWQLGNEFDVFHRDAPKSYVEAQRIGYAAAKAEDPGCIVIGGSITELQVRREGWRESLALGLAKHCDIYDFHFYGDLATTQDLLDYIHRTCREFRAEKPIWVTETTQVGMFDPDDRNQAAYVLKRVQDRAVADPNMRDKLRIVSLSFDPQHDTPAVMAEYGARLRAHAQTQS